MSSTRHGAIRAVIPFVYGLFSTGVSVSGLANLTVAIILWVLIVPVTAGAYFWPQLWPLLRRTKNLRLRWPFTLAPVAEPRLKLSPQEIAERHIRYHASPIRLADLLEVAGEDRAIIGFTFEHCILEGPGIITFRGPLKNAATGTGAVGMLMVGPTNCRVEGTPETVLYEIRPGSKRPLGAIQLAGCTIRDVTFRKLGFAGTPDELASLRKQFIFSEGSADE